MYLVKNKILYTSLPLHAVERGVGGIMCTVYVFNLLDTHVGLMLNIFSHNFKSIRGLLAVLRIFLAKASFFNKPSLVGQK